MKTLRVRGRQLLSALQPMSRQAFGDRKLEPADLMLRVRASELGSGSVRGIVLSLSPYSCLSNLAKEINPFRRRTRIDFNILESGESCMRTLCRILRVQSDDQDEVEANNMLIAAYDEMTMTVSSPIVPTPSSLHVSRRNRISKDMSTTAAPTSSRPTYSCIRCAERKVKCDRQKPCSACVKHNVDCVFNISQPPRKRHKRVQILTDRLKHYEALLQEQGITASQLPDTPDSRHDRVPDDTAPAAAAEVQLQTPSSIDSDPAQHPARYQKSQVVHGQGRSKFVEK